MKNVKKLPTKQLEKFSTIFTQLGLVLVLFIVYLTLEHKTEKKSVMAKEFHQPETVYLNPDEVPVFKREPKKQPKIKVAQNSVFLEDEPVEKGDNEIIETLIDPEPTDVKQVELNEGDIIEVDIPETIIEDVPYDFVQNAPVFKGCEGLSKEENRICFDKKMKKFVQRNFDVGLANDLGLNSGKYRISTQFIIDDKGNVVDIKIRAPHAKLKLETKGLINKLPKFSPGIQNNRPVKVKYNLPISFIIE
ncbi:hypothetical protein BW723_04560 [Polaribacter reichenbachii]|uniref:TonB C-terminal domain-containing protein n=1 Tax=Polaribacter reichenbachii TaxID=996801 RepID=A0A1B8TUL1_9FLAO|nr:energy transducer TonB [Polaribacter reichenbachii]APZ45612.1 hypothetical protein BW723_04560 [Polaribacter reichenbachii]AUC19474.1 hypothetical protein BTO17_12565 [Polaribacter reichenbachii]OBY63371.1 hypothetical protein LPB301_11150 [Polaribacter reichenbachii]